MAFETGFGRPTAGMISARTLSFGKYKTFGLMGQGNELSMAASAVADSGIDC